MDKTGLTAVLIICIINILAAVVVFIMAFFQEKGRRSTMFMLSWFIFIVPFFGPLYMVLGSVFRFLNRKKSVDLSEVSFNQEREKLILPPDAQTEMNYVPIQDAMAVSDTSSLRRLVLNTLRSNVKKTISSIAAALNSKDTETSHYAASIILDALSEFRSTSQNMIEHMKKAPEDVEMNLLAFDYIYDILDMKIMAGVEQEAYIYTLDNVAENLFTQNLWYMTASHYLSMTDLFISVNDSKMAEKWALRASRFRPDMLDTYKANLHLYYSKHDRTAFFQCMEELRDSDVIADEEIVNLFRLYSGPLTAQGE